MPKQNAFFNEKLIFLINFRSVQINLHNGVGVLFDIIRVMRVWCDIVVSAAVLINNGCRFECLAAGFQDKAM